MTRRSIEQQLAAAEEKAAQLRARVRKKQEAETHRARVLIGTFAIERLNELPALRDLVRSELLPALGRDADRELVGALLKSAPAPAPMASAANDPRPASAPVAPPIGGLNREAM